jgi:diguanylate cyclase (GGDEF)-like protein/PAS domain S-box-containing protein
MQTDAKTAAEQPPGADPGPLGEMFELPPGAHADPDSLERTLEALLAVYPQAPVGAMNSAGIYVPIPDAVDVGERPITEGRSGLDLISDDDRALVLENWDRALSLGASRCTIVPAGYEEEITLYAIDLRERHGVVFTLLASSNPLNPAAPVEVETPVQRPRFATVHKNELSFLTEVDDALLEILGWEREDLIGHRSLEFIHSDDHGLAIDNWMQMLARPGPARRVRQRMLAKDGSWVWFEVTNHNLLADPDHQSVVCEMVDISDEMAAHEDLRAREQLLDRLAETVPVGLMQLDAERQIVYTNDRLHEILGTAPAETANQQLATVDPEDRPLIEEALSELLRDGCDREVEVAVSRRGDGVLRHCQVSLRALTHEDGEVSGAIACVADVTDSIAMREELRRRATYDELTGCLNRPAITRALSEDIAAGGEEGQRAVLFVDLNGFKAVNDEHGHAAGDELLRCVGEHIRSCVRREDMVGRLGGDEFLVLCPGLDELSARRLARRIAVAAAEGPKGRTEIRASVGVTWSQGTMLDAEALLARADREMYAVKRGESAAR